MSVDPTSPPHQTWLTMTLNHAVTAALSVRLESTFAAIQMNIPNVRVMNKQALPCCGYEVDCATSIEDPKAKPSPKDVTICLNCGAWLKFDEDLRCVHFQPEDLLELSDEQLTNMRRVTQKLRGRGPIER